MRDDRLEKLARLLVQYSTEVKPGDNVFVSGEKVTIPFIEAVAAEVVKAGGHVNCVVDLPEVNESILKFGSKPQLDHPNVGFGLCAAADVWISAWGSSNLKQFSNIDPEIMRLRRLANKDHRKIYSDRMASGELRWCGTMFPTQADAQEAEMSLREYEDFVYSAGLLHMDDPVAAWRKVESEQEKLVKFLDKKSVLRLLADNTDITVGVKGRKWINCCGKVNFPDGEVFTSPVENEVNGFISFTYPAIFGGRSVENVKLTVVDGKIVNESASKGLDFLTSSLNTDPGARYFGEVAIGTNYGIPKFTRNILFDEKLGGTIHMAAGDSMGDAGGVNKSSLHWDMICDMHNGEIYADGELFYKNGKVIVDLE